MGAELCANVKERAEHDMLVDLARNDLGRVGRIGSVAVKEYASLERFSRVQHLVSRVECELAASKDALDALVACFPAGTVSGAPKIRAMEVIAELEAERRGLYTGGVGYVARDGSVTLSMAIRTMVLRGDRGWYWSGGGIVADSDPALEWEETLQKARGFAGAVGAAVEGAP